MDEVKKPGGRGDIHTLDGKDPSLLQAHESFHVSLDVEVRDEVTEKVNT